MNKQIFTRVAFFFIFFIFFSFSFFLSPLQHAGSLSGEAVLDYFTREWEQYTVSSKCLNHICNYLNRFWVKRERDEGNQKVYEVYEVSE